MVAMHYPFEENHPNLSKYVQHGGKVGGVREGKRK